MNQPSIPMQGFPVSSWATPEWTCSSSEKRKFPKISIFFGSTTVCSTRRRRRTPAPSRQHNWICSQRQDESSCWFPTSSVGRNRKPSCSTAELRSRVMFVSRGAIRSQDGRCGQSVLIEIEEGSEIDKAVIPSAIEFILCDIIDRTTGPVSDRPNTVLVSVDRSPRDFDGLVRRCSIPPSNAIDGFSEWYSFRRDTDVSSKTKEPKMRQVQIGTHNPCSKEKGSLAREILEALDASVRRNSKHRIVVLDSLSSVFGFWPGVHTFLDLRDSLYESASKGGSDCSLTLLGVIRRTRGDTALLASLRRAVDTSVILSQGQRIKNASRLHAAGILDNVRDLVTLKICRRKMSGRVQLDEVITRIKRENYTLTQVEVRSGSFNDAPVLSSKEEEERRQEKTLSELGLSFRVSLSTKEKEVRAAAGLPYLHQDEDLADSGLQLHPQVLQIGASNAREGTDPGSADDDTDSDEELFSEDV